MLGNMLNFPSSNATPSRRITVGILFSVRKPVYRTTDGREFASGDDAADEQVRISLEVMMQDRRFKPSPGQAGNWSWSSVVGFISNNREELRILLDNVQPRHANNGED
jgi:hypothetical protein